MITRHQSTGKNVNHQDVTPLQNFTPPQNMGHASNISPAIQRALDSQTGPIASARRILVQNEMLKSSTFSEKSASTKKCSVSESDDVLSGFAECGRL
jgi:hypothetical protein